MGKINIGNDNRFVIRKRDCPIIQRYNLSVHAASPAINEINKLETLDH